MRKASVKDGNAEYVQKLQVVESATDQEIQNALHQLFKSSPQGQNNTQNNQGPQGQSIWTTKLPQGAISPTNDELSPQGITPSIIAATVVSKIQLNNVLKNSLHSALQKQVPYSDILLELFEGERQIIKNNLIFNE